MIYEIKQQQQQQVANSRPSYDSFLDFYRLGSTAIYSILDWSKPRGTSLVCIGTLIFLILLHYFAYGVYRSRICLARRLIGDKEPSQSKTGIPNGGFVLEGVGALKVDERPNQTQTGITNVAFVPESA